MKFLVCAILGFCVPQLLIAGNAGNNPITVPHEVTAPNVSFISSTQDPPEAAIGESVTITWKWNADAGYHRDQYRQGENPPSQKMIENWGVSGYGPAGGGSFTITKTTQEVAKNGKTWNWDIGGAWYYDPCDGVRHQTSPPGNCYHTFNLKPKDPTKDPTPDGSGDDGSGGGGGGTGDGGGDDTPKERPDQGEAELSGEIVDAGSNVMDPDRGMVPTRSNGYVVIPKTDLADLDNVGRYDIPISILHRIVTINSPEERDLKGVLQFSLEEGNPQDYVVYHVNSETGVKEQISMPFSTNITEPGHVGDGVHDWHLGTEQFIFRRTGDGALKLKITVNPEKGQSLKVAYLWLLPVGVKSYYGKEWLTQAAIPKCYSDRVNLGMEKHVYPAEGSDGGVYLQSGDTFDLSVSTPNFSNVKSELVYSFMGEEVLKKEVPKKSGFQVVKLDPSDSALSWINAALGANGYSLSVRLKLSVDGQEIFRTSDYSFLIDNAILRNALFKIKVKPMMPGSVSKGSYSEVLMGLMLHEVSREIVKLVESNIRDYTANLDLKLKDPTATQGTNRLIVSTLGRQMGESGSEWDTAAAEALELEQAVISTQPWKLPNVIFSQAFPKFEAIENRVRGEGWATYGCPYGGDDAVLKAASLRGVQSAEVFKEFADYTQATKVIPLQLQQMVAGFVVKGKIEDLTKNFLSSYAVGGCCN